MSTDAHVSLDPAAATALWANDGKRVSRLWLAFWGIFLTAAYALLWSPYWYPLSDSSHYLLLGRSLAAGRGLTMMGDPVKLTPPLGPLVISWIIKAGGNIGAIQAVMTTLMLISHGLCFLALRRIVGERLALPATVAGAMSYWVFANAFTIMSEPPALVLFWGGVWTLASVSADESNRRQWFKVILAGLLFLGAAAARDAVLAIVPGLLLMLPGAIRPGLKLAGMLLAPAVAGLGVIVIMPGKGKTQSDFVTGVLLIAFAHALAFVIWKSWLKMVAWLDRFKLPAERPLAWRHLLAVLGILSAWVVLYRYPPRFLQTQPMAKAPTTRSTTGPTTTQPSVVPTPVMAKTPMSAGEGDEEVPREGRYRTMFLQGVNRNYQMITDPPALGGRWVCEGLVMASVGVFESRNPAIKAMGYVAGVTAMILAAWGLGAMIRRGQYWLLGPAMYFVLIWLQWGTRLKPRYMIPMAPMLFLVVWAALSRLLIRPRKVIGPDPLQSHGSHRLAWGLACVIIVCNAFPWFVEYRIRHDQRDFFDLARSGAFAELVDICGWLQQNTDPDDDVWLNNGAHRRVVYYLSGRPVQEQRTPARSWKEWDSVGGLSTHEEDRARSLRKFRRAIPQEDRFILVFVDEPAKGQTWPGWHWPQPKSRVTFWRLYMRTALDTWQPVDIRYPLDSAPRAMEPLTQWMKLSPRAPSRDYAKAIPPAAR